MTTQEIFKANQILTLEKAKELKGKKIFTTNAEYKANRPTVNEFVVGRIISQWDLALLEECPGFNNRQEYWLSYMNPNQIDECKEKLILLDINGKKIHVAHTGRYNFYNEPTFTGSDADREVYYIEA
jgi:hypothetical protein